MSSNTIVRSKRSGDKQRDFDAASLADTIDLKSLSSISKFGQNFGRQISVYTDQLLDNANVRDLDQAGKKLEEIVQRAKQFDMRHFDSEDRKLPPIAKVLRGLFASKERTIARFDTIKGQVDTLVSAVKSTATMLERRNAAYENMYNGVSAEYDNLRIHIDAIDQAIAKADELICNRTSHDDDVAALESIETIKSARVALKKRKDDLAALRHSAMQMLPMVRIIQTNNLSLIDKFDTIQTLTLPAWKRMFLMWLALSEQKDTVELAKSIDAATSTFMKANADLLHHNSVETAKAGQSLVIDIETLKHVHNQIVRTIEDVKQIHDEGAVERADAMQQLEHLRKCMLSGEKVGDAKQSPAKGGEQIY